MVGGGVSAQVALGGEQEDLDGDSLLEEMPGHDEAVAAVVALSRHDQDAPGGKWRVALLHVANHADAGVFHEDQPGDAVFTNRALIKLSHFA